MAFLLVLTVAPRAVGLTCLVLWNKGEELVQHQSDLKAETPPPLLASASFEGPHPRGLGAVAYVARCVERPGAAVLGLHLPWFNGREAIEDYLPTSLKTASGLSEVARAAGRSEASGT